jgi:hypothetical protein
MFRSLMLGLGLRRLGGPLGRFLANLALEIFWL